MEPTVESHLHEYMSLLQTAAADCVSKYAMHICTRFLIAELVFCLYGWALEADAFFAGKEQIDKVQKDHEATLGRFHISSSSRAESGLIND